MKTLDPITLEVIQERLISIVREMRGTLARVAYSSVLYEARDFSCVVMNARGEAVAQSEDNPGHIIPLPWSVRIAMERFKDDIHPGDVILINDPYSGGTHLNDVAVIYPVFLAGKLFLFPAIRAHWADVGGMTPGSLSGTSTEIFQEGVRIPPIKVYERGVEVKGVTDLMFANMRVEPERRGDLQAMIETCRTAERRIEELAQKFGVEVLLDAMEKLFDRTEVRMRELISQIPDGEYCYEDYLDASGTTTDPILLKARVQITGSDVHVDFSGTSKQVEGPINGSLAVTTTAVFTILKTVLDPDSPINHGAFRPVTVTAPEGTILNARFPAACGGFAEIRRRTQSVVMGALSRALPLAIAGDVKGSANHCYVGGMSAEGRHFIFYEYPAGGTGGYLEQDGSSAFRSYDEGDFSSIQPVESIENEFPLTIERCSLRTDSGGAGTTRGGLGIEREIQLNAERASYSVLSDRCILSPFGLHGGLPGAPNSFTYRRDGVEGQPGKMPGKATGFQLQKADVVIMRSAGGGGYGDPLKRTVDRVEADVKEGYVTAKAALQDYGVVIGKDGAVDRAASEKLRAKQTGERQILMVAAADTMEASEYDLGRRWIQLHPGTAKRAALSAGGMLEIVTQSGAPLRAWIKLSAEVPLGAVWIGAEGMNILGLAAGDKVEIRGLKEVGISRTETESLKRASGK